MFPRRDLHARLAITFVLSATLAAGASLALADTATAAPAASRSATRLMASDNMHRFVSVGLGRASRGGRYAVSSARGARVDHHSAVLGPVSAGQTVAAWLPQVRVFNTRAKASFRLAQHRSLGGGQYFELGLRRLSAWSTYLAKVRLVPGQGVFVGVSRVRSGHETLLGTETRVLPASAMHGWLNVQASALGNSPVRLAIRVWRSGHAKPAGDQVAYRDTSSSRIVRAGSIGFQSYLSRTASGPTVIDFRHVRVWRQRTTAGTSTGSNPPSSNPPSSNPPSSNPPSSNPPSTNPPTGNPPTTGSTAGAGSVPLGQTSYPIPSGAVFVSPSGSDSAAGTQNAPLRTLAKAIAVAPSGGTIVMRAGSYNESVQDYNKPLTIQNYPGEVVWLDGSTNVTGWTQQGSTWVHTGWTPQFNHVPSDTGTVSTAPNWSFVNSTYPMAAWPDQVWSDGSPLTQVGSAAAVGAGDFYADYADDEIVVGSDPTSHLMQASNLGLALTTYATGFTFRGIGVRRYASSLNQFGSLRLLGKNNTVQNVVVADNATTGLFMDNSNDVVDHVTATGNGLMGFAGAHVNGISVTGLLAQGNNSQHFNQSPESGGMKIGLSRGITVTGSVFSNNFGPGAWFDCSDYNAVVVGNVMSGNTGHGVSYEISSTALLADNVVQNNGGDGFKINDSDHVRLWNNTITGNGRDIEIVEDARRGTDMSVPGHNNTVPQPDPTEPWTITNDSVMNNILSPNGSGYQLYVYDYSQQYTADNIGLVVDGNQFLRGTPSAMIVWGQGKANPKLFTSAAAFVAGTGQGSHNLDVASGASMYDNAGGVPLPGDVAAAIGQPAGTVHLGAF